MDKKLFAYAKDMDLVVHKTNGRHSTLIVTPEDMGSEGFIIGMREYIKKFHLGLSERGYLTTCRRRGHSLNASR